MNEYLEALILGIVQGLTEFLPVSSDGHLELAKWLLGDTANASDSFMMTIILHFGTAFAIVWVFRKSIIQIIRNIATKDGKRFLLLILISMIPAVIVGVGFEDEIETLFHNQIVMVGIFLMINGAMLIASDYFSTKGKPVTNFSSLLIGIAQAIAILPGISRSGSTIATSVALGIDRKEAAHFSFLMVVPLLFGKMAKDIVDGKLMMNETKALPLLLGFVCSLVVGIIACQWMLKIVQKAKLGYFGIYCLAVGLAAIIIKTFFWS